MPKPVQIVRKKLTPTEVSNPNLRYNSSCDCVQITPDGGATWYDMSSLDPRTSTSLQLPPRTSSDPQCDAAANMLEKLQAIVGQFTAGLDQLSLVNTLVAILAPFMPEVALILEVIEAIAAAALAIGAAIIASAFTSDQWALILCILKCNISADGTVTPSQVTAILSAIHDQCDSIVYDVMYFVLPALGNIGLSNAGATGDVVGDCTDCACGWCYEESLLVAADLWTVTVGYFDGISLRSVEVIPDVFRCGISFSFSLAPDSTVDSIELGVYHSGTAHDSTINYPSSGYDLQHPPNGDSIVTWYNPLVAGDGTYEFWQTVFDGATRTYWVRARGTGTSPFAHANNCV